VGVEGGGVEVVVGGGVEVDVCVGVDVEVVGVEVVLPTVDPLLLGTVVPPPVFTGVVVVGGGGGGSRIIVLVVVTVGVDVYEVVGGQEVRVGSLITSVVIVVPPLLVVEVRIGVENV